MAAKRHYINNGDFLKSLTEYREKYQKAKADGTTLPRIPEYVGECITKMANKLAARGNFCNYTFKEEMIDKAIETCITYINNFDPAKTSQAFSYFNRICWNAFITVIKDEKH